MLIMHIFAAKKTSWHKRAKPGLGLNAINKREGVFFTIDYTGVRGCLAEDDRQSMKLQHPLSERLSAAFIAEFIFFIFIK